MPLRFRQIRRRCLLSPTTIITRHTELEEFRNNIVVENEQHSTHGSHIASVTIMLMPRRLRRLR